MSAIGSASGPIPILNHHLEWVSQSNLLNQTLILLTLASRQAYTYLRPHIHASSSLCVVPELPLSLLFRRPRLSQGGEYIDKFPSFHPPTSQSPLTSRPLHARVCLFFSVVLKNLFPLFRQINYSYFDNCRPSKRWTLVNGRTSIGMQPRVQNDPS